MQSVAVIDYGMGNLHSVERALRHEAPPGTHIVLTNDLAVIRDADRLVFPGQGAAADAMHALRALGLETALPELAATRPFLGMCLGQQILLDWSAENGGVDLLGVIPGRVERFPDHAIDNEGHRLKVPHMGWNMVRQVREHPLWHGLPQESWFYFVHSYRVRPTQAESIVGETDYGDAFASVIARDSMFAMQCHPEKSAADGLRLLNNFLRWDGAWR